ncbi:hypothetical protein A4X09_0g458 [Tilletia walkeri]|uniref:Uncharacterized protein n=1 Tax=Tilletia walkeri TaxID=117179 RepID=A0A8X7T7K3_9BASI|nr:hypothetical protein A4X09_0g458 [Tilletia walkeri]
MPSRPPFRPAPSLKPAEAAAKAAVSNKTLSHLLPNYVARLPPPPPTSDTVKALRKNYKFAAVCQFLFTFGDALLVGEEWDSKRLEDALDGKDSSYVPKLCIKVLQTLTLNRNIDTSNYINIIQAQADKRSHRQLPVSDTLKARPLVGSDPFPVLPSLVVAPPPGPAPTASTSTEVQPTEAEDPPQGTIEAAEGKETNAQPAPAPPVQLIRDITTLPAVDQVEILHILCEWHMMDPDRLRKLLKSEDDAQSWRVEPIGWDAQDNTYYLFDDNRLWIQRARPKKPRPVAVTSAKKGAKAAKNGTKGKQKALPPKKGASRNGRGNAAIASAPPRKRGRPSKRAAVDSDEEDDDFGLEAENGTRRPSAKRRGVASGGRVRAVATASTTTPTSSTGRRGRKSGGSGAEGSPSSPSLSGPRQLRTRNGPPPPYAYQTGLTAVPLARGIRASSRIRGGGPGGSGPFGEDGWQRIPEALLELDESIREEDGLKKGRRRSSRHAGADDDEDEFREEVAEEEGVERPEADEDAMQQDDVEQAAGEEEGKEKVNGGDGGDAKMVDAEAEPEDQGKDEKPVEDSTSVQEKVKDDVPDDVKAEAEAEHKAGDASQEAVDNKPSVPQSPAPATPSKSTPAVKKDEELSDEAEDDDLSELSDLSEPDDDDNVKADSSDDDSLTPLEEIEDEEDEYEPVAADFVEFEALCVTKAEWEAFGGRFAGSRNKNEKALHTVLNDTILPRILEDFAEQERQLALEVVMASRKRSSRIASRDSEREERERLEAARMEQEAKMAKLREEEIARTNKERAEAEAAAAREERIREREERMAAREREIISRMEREEAERIKAEKERELRVAKRKAAIEAGREVSRSASYEPEDVGGDGDAQNGGEPNGGTATGAASNGASGLPARAVLGSSSAVSGAGPELAEPTIVPSQSARPTASRPAESSSLPIYPAVQNSQMQTNGHANHASQAALAGINSAFTPQGPIPIAGAHSPTELKAAVMPPMPPNAAPSVPSQPQAALPISQAAPVQSVPVIPTQPVPVPAHPLGPQEGQRAVAEPNPSGLNPQAGAGGWRPAPPVVSSLPPPASPVPAPATAPAPASAQSINGQDPSIADPRP